MQDGAVVSEVLPKSGLVFSEKGCLTYVLSKPKIMAIKSVTLQKLEEMEKKAAELGQVDIDDAAMAAVENNKESARERIRQQAARAEQEAKRAADRARSKQIEEEARRKFAASADGAVVQEGKSGDGSSGEANVWRAED